MASPTPTSPALPSPSTNHHNRFQIILSFWTVILLSLPIWWNTTKIERRSLPESDLASWVHRNPCPIRFPIKLSSATTEVSEASVQAEIGRLNARLESDQQTYEDAIDILAARCFDIQIDSLTTSTGNHVVLHRSPHDIHNHTSLLPVQPDIRILLSTENKPNELLRRIAPLSSSSSSLQAQDSRVIKYSSQLKLVFSLMNEDITQPGFVRSWSIKHALELHFEPILASLSPLHNFTCHTQILHHSPLAFDPTLLEPQGTDEKAVHVVEEEELKAFINDADWNLASSVTMDPVIHFVLWVPSQRHRPFKIRRTDGTLLRDGSFIRPQWGSVVIYNPDEPNDPPGLPQLDIGRLARPLQIFRHHLLSLLGLADALHTPDQRALALDAIIRRRIVENSLESINSLQVIVKLINDQTNMRVSTEVQHQVKDSLKALQSAQESLASGGSLFRASVHADESKRLSSTAFFSPTMLSLLYFPDEHKYAIYTPLFGPILVPLVLGLVKELKARKKQKEQKEKEE